MRYQTALRPWAKLYNSQQFLLSVSPSILLLFFLTVSTCFARFIFIFFFFPVDVEKLVWNSIQYGDRGVLSPSGWKKHAVRDQTERNPIKTKITTSGVVWAHPGRKRGWETRWKEKLEGKGKGVRAWLRLYSSNGMALSCWGFLLANRTSFLLTQTDSSDMGD